MKSIIISRLFAISILFCSQTVVAANKVVVIPLFGDGNKVQTVTSQTGRVWMGSNLGAYELPIAPDDHRGYGWLYQWGRLADGHELRTSPTSPTLSTKDVPGHGSFITVKDTPYDWRFPQNNYLWKGVSGINNPCPSSFRIPTVSEWEEEFSTWSSQNAAGAFNSVLKLPLPGYRYDSNAQILNAGTLGFYWSSNDIGGSTGAAYINKDIAKISEEIRAFGFSVRCIKD